MLTHTPLIFFASSLWVLGSQDNRHLLTFLFPRKPPTEKISKGLLIFHPAHIGLHQSADYYALLSNIDMYHQQYTTSRRSSESRKRRGRQKKVNEFVSLHAWVTSWASFGLPRSLGIVYVSLLQVVCGCFSF